MSQLTLTLTHDPRRTTTRFHRRNLGRRRFRRRRPRRLEPRPLLRLLVSASASCSASAAVTSWTGEPDHDGEEAPTPFENDSLDFSSPLAASPPRQALASGSDGTGRCHRKVKGGFPEQQQQQDMRMFASSGRSCGAWGERASGAEPIKLERLPTGGGGRKSPSYPFLGSNPLRLAVGFVA